jgi:hypothetical protein
MRKSQDILELWDSLVAPCINKFGDESIIKNYFVLYYFKKKYKILKRMASV